MGQWISIPIETCVLLHLTAGTHVVFLAMNVVEGLGVLLMFKPFLSVKKETPSEQLH